MSGSMTSQPSPVPVKAVSGSSTPHFLSRSYMSRDEMLVKERLKRTLPFARSPFNLQKKDRGAEADLKPSWTNLFCDLTFVAALTVFATAHEAVSGAEVGSFIAFIVLLWWTWCSYTFFDVKYARDDIVTQFFAAINVAVFAFLGAYSIGFRPYILYKEPDFDALALNPLTADAEPTTEDLNAYTSWSGTLKAFAVGRLVLGLQYLWTITCYGWNKRPSPALILPLIGLTVSGAIALGFSFDQARTSTQNATRLGLLYSAVALEIVLAAVVANLRTTVRHAHSHLLLERIALLTLIILGEGFIALTKNMSNVVSGFGFTSEQYLYVFSAIALYFLAWSLIFGPFNGHATMSAARTQIYALLHLPLHITLLLWLEGVVVAILFYNFQEASTLNTSFTFSVFEQIASYFEPLLTQQGRFPTSNFTLSFNTSRELLDTAKYLELTSDSLGSFNHTLSEAVYQINASLGTWIQDNPNGNATERLEGGILTYLTLTLSSSIIQVAAQYGISFDDEVTKVLNSLNEIDYDYGDTSPDIRTLAMLEAAIANTIIPSCLFIIPCAGGWLLMTVLLTVIQRPPRDRFDILLLAYRAVIGVVFCFLGFLDIGRKHYSVASDSNLLILPQGPVFSSDFAPAFFLLQSGWLLPMLVLALASIVIFEYIVLWMAKKGYKRDGPRTSQSAVDRNEEKGEEEDQNSSGGLKDTLRGPAVP